MKVFKAKYKKGNLSKISFVEAPAIEENFITLAKEVDEIIFKFNDESKREILTPVLIPYKLIPRNPVGNINEPFLLEFDAETIKQISYDVIANKELKFNEEHTKNDFNGVVLQQVFLSDKEKGINPAGFEHLPSGTLFSVLKIENDEVWQSVLNGTFKGVSAEVALGLEFEEEVNENAITLHDILKVVRKCQQV